MNPMEETELGYKLKGYSANNAQGVEGQGTVIVYNEVLPPQTINIVVRKTDNAENSTNYLEGAVFRLEYRAQNSGPWTNVSNSDVPELDIESKFSVPKGGITLTGLKAGQYRLHELSAPAGYVISEANPVVFTVSNGGITGTEGTIAGVRYTAASGSNNAEFVVPNTPGVVLPQTGGAGTALFTVIGGIMTALAGAVLVLKKRKEHV